MWDVRMRRMYSVLWQHFEHVATGPLSKRPRDAELRQVAASAKPSDSIRKASIAKSLGIRLRNIADLLLCLVTFPQPDI